MNTSVATAESQSPASVEEEIIQRAKRSYERLPILEVILERFALAAGPAIKPYVGAICEANIESVTALREQLFATLLALPGTAARLHASTREQSTPRGVVFFCLM